MIRRLALTAGFAVLGAVAFAPKAHGQAAPAAQEDVMFEGTVGSVCTLSDPTPGTLALVDTDPSILSSETVGGESGTITVNCTGENQVSVTSVTAGEVPEGFTAQSAIATLSDGTNTTNSNAPTPLNVTNDADVPLDVDLVVESDTALPAGSYEYTVTVTATPS